MVIALVMKIGVTAIMIDKVELSSEPNQQYLENSVMVTV